MKQLSIILFAIILLSSFTFAQNSIQNKSITEVSTDSSFNVFWNEFKETIAKDSYERMQSLTNFPLIMFGGWLGNSVDNKEWKPEMVKEIKQEDFKKIIRDIFLDNLKSQIKNNAISSGARVSEAFLCRNQVNGSVNRYNFISN